MNTGQSIAKKRRIDSSKPYDIIIQENQATILEVLRQQNVNLKTLDENGNTFIHLVLKNEQLIADETIEVLVCLLDKGVDPNIQNNEELTALHLAVAKKIKEAIDLLIKRGAQIDVVDKKSNSIAHYFIKSEHEKYLNLSKTQNIVYCHEEEKETADFLEWLISKGFNFDRRNHCKNSQSTLHLAIDLNLQHILPTLLRHTADITKRSRNNLLHLFLKSSRSRPEVTRFIQRHAVEIVKILLDRGVPVDVVIEGKTALDLALETNAEMDVLKMMIERSSNIHRKTESGQTLFHQVIARQRSWCTNDEDYLDMIRSLVEKGSDVNNRDRTGTRPIHVVAGQTDFAEELIDLLVGAGCDVNATDGEGQTPLHLAIARHSSSVKKLIEHGADVNYYCESRGVMRPLHLAVEEQNLPAVKLLLSNGADVNITNFRTEETPVQPPAKRRRKRGTPKAQPEPARARVQDSSPSVLSRAIELYDSAAVEELLKYGADVNHESVILASKQGANVISKHLFKLKVVDISCSREYDVSIEGAKHSHGYESFHRNCLVEIEKLKETFIDDRVSLYDFLRMDAKRRLAYNHKLDDFSDLQEQFPNYFVLISASYHETARRKSLLEPAKAGWLELTKIRLPDICIERILSFLDDADLIEMARKKRRS